MNELKGLRWSPSWITHLGCVKGCLDYLGLEISDGWLHGGTGHAFVINMHDEVCPSGPTAWNTSRLFELGRNLGYESDAVFGWQQEGNLPALQREAWDLVRRSIDEGIPCYGWELAMPEFYVVYGYDDTGYYYSGAGCDEGAGPKPWQELGDTGIGLVEMYNVRRGEAADDRTTVRAALAFALQFAEDPGDWLVEGYATGTQAYDWWIAAVESGRASRLGMGYNAAVWQECRHHAVEFLLQASERLELAPARLLEDALAHYQELDRLLEELTQLYPFERTEAQETIARDEKARAAASVLQCARDAEAAGLSVLRELLEALGGPLEE